ncbi:DUF3017 domain-containing protein [Streptomyces castrisilvae]|uniref:DUF3017 domain-containing protein n=1 Tax=Streptomyces castrisilvae TaxID=3033811 RepID=A0ABY9HP46_9ACTN|nr:DUF3017 domain-containing protein [Streptomyces sp. Mut1]WLQ35817.1 DUF3017 domain-containing protein [Streptomyces sp. Mut1]
MGAGTSPADRAASETGPATEGAAPEREAAESATGEAGAAPAGAGAANAGAADAESAERDADAATVGAADAGAADAERDAADAATAGAGEAASVDAASGPSAPSASGSSPVGEAPAGEAGGARRSRRFSLTRDTARPEGGGRAAAGDAPAPARQWPLLAVLCTAGAGLLIVAANPFDEAFRIGTILIGVALVAGAVLRLVVRSVGMLAVRSRFTDLVTYGLLGVLIVMLSLVAQPKPWLDIPFLEDAVHFTVR